MSSDVSHMSDVIENLTQEGFTIEFKKADGPIDFLKMTMTKDDFKTVWLIDIAVLKRFKSKFLSGEMRKVAHQININIGRQGERS